MILQFHTPVFPINTIVDSFTFYEGLIQEHSIERLLPDGSSNLIIELDNIPKYTFDNNSLEVKEKYLGAWISGMQKEFISIGAEVGSSMLIIRFQPTGPYSVFGIPMYELNDKVLDADIILGSEIQTLRDQLLEAPTGTQKFNIVEQWLASFLKEQPPSMKMIRYATEEISRNPTLERIKTLSDSFGYSQKQFIQLFKTQVGLTPKYFQRVIRFNKVLEELEAKKQVNWTRLSQDCGFYDQAHFIREFRQFSGFNPQEFLRTEREYKNYVIVA